jgi:hypothetical protein
MFECCSAIFGILLLVAVVNAFNKSGNTRQPAPSSNSSVNIPNQYVQAMPVPIPRHATQAILFTKTNYPTDIDSDEITIRQLLEKLKQENKLKDLNISFQDLHKFQFSECELIDVDLSSSDLIGLSFSGSRLQNVNFSGAFLAYSDFSGAVLQNVNFTNCDLSMSNFQNAQIVDGSFDQADLSQAEFIGSMIENSSFIASQKSRAKNLEVL